MNESHLQPNSNRTATFKQPEDYHEKPEDNYHLWLKSKLAKDRKVSSTAKVLFSLLSGFFGSSGYAFCSNDWFMHYMAKDKRQIRRLLDNLEKRGYIYREFWHEGKKQKRRIWIPEEYLSYLFRNGMSDPGFFAHLKKVESNRRKEKPIPSYKQKMSQKMFREDIFVPPSPSAREDIFVPIIDKGNAKVTTQTIVDKSEVVSVEPPLLPSLKKRKKKKQPKADQSSLALFDPNRNYLKGKSESEIRLLYLHFQKKKHSIKEPIAYLTACSQNGWHLQHVKNDEYLVENYRCAKKIEKNFDQSGNNCGYTYFNANADGMAFMKGGKEVPLPDYDMEPTRFKEYMEEILITKNNYSKDIFL